MNNQEIIDQYIQNILFHSPKEKPYYILHPLFQISLGAIRHGLRIHLYGRPASGKTALAASISVWAAMLNQKVLWLDTSYSFPDEFLSNQMTPELQANIYVSRTYTSKMLALAPKMYDLIIIDDTDSFMYNNKRQIIPFATTCSRYGCTVIFISQVRRDIRQTKDLVPGTALVNADLIINTVRSEMLNEQTCRFRYSSMIRGYRGRFKFRNYHFEADYIGLDIMKLLLDLCIKTNIIQKRGILLYYNEKNIGSINEVARKNRLNFEFMLELYDKLSGVEDADRWISNTSGQPDNNDATLH